MAAEERRAFVARIARRTMPLLSATTVVATGMLAPVPTPGEPDVSSTHIALSHEVVQSGWHLVAPTPTAPELVGFTWTGRHHGAVAVRARAEDRWTEWLVLEGLSDEGPDASSVEAKSFTSAGPAWLGRDIDEVEVRVEHGHLDELTLVAIDSDPVTQPSGPLGVAGALVSEPFITPRAGWGADEGWRNLGNEGCSGRPSYAKDVRFAVVHHTVNANDYSLADVPALLRGIYHFHTHTNGWCDIGYNFLVDRFGRLYEGRFGGVDRPVIGGHAGGFNSGSTGVAVLGNFQESRPPTSVYSALRRLLAWKLSIHGVDPLGTTAEITGDNPSAKWPNGTPVVLPTVSAHRDTNATSCPGQFLAALLPQLRRDVAADIKASPPSQRLVCDWDGDGTDTVGHYDVGVLTVRNTNGYGSPDAVLSYGVPTDVAVCGDWNGDGTDTVGVFRRGAWFLRNSNSSGIADLVVGYGDPGDVPVVRRSTDASAASLGVFRNGMWFVRTAPLADAEPQTVAFAYGDPGDRPLMGDWDGDGTATPAVVRLNRFYFRNSLSGGVADRATSFGNPSDGAVAGAFAGPESASGIGVTRGAWWYLSKSPASPDADLVFGF